MVPKLLLRWPTQVHFVCFWEPLRIQICKGAPKITARVIILLCHQGGTDHPKEWPHHNHISNLIGRRGHGGDMGCRDGEWAHTALTPEHWLLSYGTGLSFLVWALQPGARGHSATQVWPDLPSHYGGASLSFLSWKDGWAKCEHHCDPIHHITMPRVQSWAQPHGTGATAPGWVQGGPACQPIYQSRDPLSGKDCCSIPIFVSANEAVLMVMQQWDIKGK